ncbi:lipoate--protein ligase [Francisellaceae bacterium]|nr:lipoate--protein ligase [Francisellaceae bacterium]
MTIPANIIYSKITDPYINLGIENWIFKNLVDNEPILFLWQSSPAIIIGRAQNPWLECNLSETTKDNIPIVRRQSGGGTVFHDLGNINFTFLMPNQLYDKKKHLQVIVKALESLDIKAEINDRNDIITNVNNYPFKLSGSAYRETKHTSFHHGTLLIASDLNSLEKYLHHKIDKNINAKGVSSVRSKVTSIEKIKQDSASVTKIYNAIEASFKDIFQISHHKPLIIDYDFISSSLEIKRYADSINNWYWTYSKTLPFEYNLQINTLEYIKLYVKQGKIINFDHNIASSEPLNLIEFLRSQPLLNIDTLNTFNASIINHHEKDILKRIQHLFT